MARESGKSWRGGSKLKRATTETWLFRDVENRVGCEQMERWWFN